MADDEIPALDALEKAVLKALPNGTINAFNKATQAVEFAKTVTADAITAAVSQLRYPIEDKRVRFHFFGNFEVYCDNRPAAFSLSKTKELLAYLVYGEGTECRKNEIIASIPL